MPKLGEKVNTLVRNNLTLSNCISAEIVKWVSQSLRPFDIVEDEGFKSLMLTGRPGYKLPSKWTVARDVWKVFAKAKDRVATLLQERCRFLSVLSIS